MNNTKVALYAGSFDPATLGHLDVIGRAAQVFNQVYVGIGISQTKKYLFDQKERHYLMRALNKWDNVKIIDIPSNRLTVDIAYEMQAVLVKGVRLNAADFDYEWLLRDIGLAHHAGVDTFVLPAMNTFNKVSSSAAKEICKLQGNTEEFVPLQVKAAMESRLTKQYRIGVTGSIGTGKSTITREIVSLLKSRGEQAHDIDIDAIAGDIMFTRQEPAYVNLRLELQELLGIKEWTRAEIGRIIFSQEDKRIALNKRLISPLMTRLRAEMLGKEGVILINCALLAESNLLPLVNNNVVLLHTRVSEQRQRLAKRGYSAEQIDRRIRSQMSWAQKNMTIRHAIVNENYGTVSTFSTDRQDPKSTAAMICDEFIKPRIYEAATLSNPLQALAGTK